VIESVLRWPRMMIRMRMVEPEEFGAQFGSTLFGRDVILRTHQEDWVRAKLGDRRLGFDDDELKKMLTASGLADVRVGVGARKAGDPFTVLIASGTKQLAHEVAKKR